MFKRIGDFKINGWTVIVIALIIIAAVAQGVANSRQARQDAANLVASLPVKNTAKIDGSAAPTTAAPKVDDAITVDPKTGAQRLGNTAFNSERDEITGASTWRVTLLEKAGASQGIGLRGGEKRTSVSLVFPSILDSDSTQKVVVQARFTLRDGTAAVREYTMISPSGASVATSFSNEVINDIASLMSASAYVAFRAPALGEEPTMLRMDVDPVDWAASAKSKRLVTLKESRTKPVSQT